MKTVETMRSLVQEGLDQEEAHRITELSAKPEARCVIILKAFGIPSNIIEFYFDIKNEDARYLLLLDEFKTLNNKITHELAIVQDERYFENLVPRALQIKMDILEDPDASITLREKIASDIIDRAKGKPRQSLEVKSLNYNIEGTQEDIDNKISAVTARIAELEGFKTKQLKAAKKV